MDLGVVVVNWNSGQHLTRLIGSLRPLWAELRDVVVVDNASADSPRSALSQDCPVHWVQLEDNQGFAGAANHGIGLLKSEFALLLNPDVAVQAQSIRVLFQRASRLPEAAIVCGPLLDPAGKAQTAFQLRDFPTWRSALCDALFLDHLLGKRNRGPQMPGLAPDGSDVDQPAAAYWLLRRQAFQELGGFDTRFHPAWFEDVDFCKRARGAGWRILYFEDCPAQHEGGYSLKHLGRRRFASYYYNNYLRYLEKHHPRAFPWLWLPLKLGIALRRSGVGR